MLNIWVDQVGFGEFGVLWLKPTPTCYQKKFVIQPNPPNPKNRPNWVGWVGSGQFWRVGCTLLFMRGLRFSQSDCMVRSVFQNQDSPPQSLRSPLMNDISNSGSGLKIRFFLIFDWAFMIILFPFEICLYFFLFFLKYSK